MYRFRTFTYIVITYKQDLNPLTELIAHLHRLSPELGREDIPVPPEPHLRAVLPRAAGQEVDRDVGETPVLDLHDGVDSLKGGMGRKRQDFNHLILSTPVLNLHLMSKCLSLSIAQTL